MKELPILYSTQMVRAVINDTKTNTRRVMKPQPLWIGDPNTPFSTTDADPKGIIKCPYGKKDDLLWVRETWSLWLNDEGPDGFRRCIKFAADDSIMIVPEKYYAWWDEKAKRGYLNRPSIFMPKWATRLWLRVTAIRVERLQDISEEDAEKEGVEHNTLDGVPIPDEYYKYPIERYEDGFPAFSAVESFETLWDSINGKPRKDGKDISWAANPWVWVIEFERDRTE